MEEDVPATRSLEPTQWLSATFGSDFNLDEAECRGAKWAQSSIAIFEKLGRQTCRLEAAAHTKEEVLTETLGGQVGDRKRSIWVVRAGGCRPRDSWTDTGRFCLLFSCTRDTTCECSRSVFRIRHIFCGHDQHPDPTQDGTGFDAPSDCWRWSHGDVLSRVCGEDLFCARTSP